jgi:TonB family protein
MRFAISPVASIVFASVSCASPQAHVNSVSATAPPLTVDCATLPKADPDITQPELMKKVSPLPHDTHEPWQWACLEATVTTAGTLADIRVVKASNPFWGRDSVAAMKQWRYRPATRNGEPIEIRINVSTTVGIELRR